MYMCILHHITTKSQSLLIQILCKTHFRFFRKWYPKLCKIIKRLLCCLKGGFPHPVKSSFNEIIEVLVQSEIQIFFQRSAPLPNKFWHISSIAKLHLQLTILDVKICKCYFAMQGFSFSIWYHIMKFYCKLMKLVISNWPSIFTLWDKSQIALYYEIIQTNIIPISIGISVINEFIILPILLVCHIFLFANLSVKFYTCTVTSMYFRFAFIRGNTVVYLGQGFTGLPAYSIW